MLRRRGLERKRIGQREDRRGTVVQRAVGGGEEAGGDASTVVRRDRGKDVGLGYAARCWVMVHVVGMLSCLCATCGENAMRGERGLEKWPQRSSRKPLTATAHIQTRHRIAAGRICRNRTHAGQKRVRRTSTAYQVWCRPVACTSLCYIYADALIQLAPICLVMAASHHVMSYDVRGREAHPSRHVSHARHLVKHESRHVQITL